MDSQRKQWLGQLKEYGIREKIPNISLCTAQWLHQFISDNKNIVHVLEIGTANGYSTIWMLDALEAREGARVLGIDISESTHWELRQNLAAQKLAPPLIDARLGDAVQLLPGFATNPWPNFKGFDLVFLDARKIWYRKFWQAFEPLLAPNGWVVIDDMKKFREKTAAFESFITNHPEYQHQWFHTDPDDALLLVWKKTSKAKPFFAS